MGKTNFKRRILREIIAMCLINAERVSCKSDFPPCWARALDFLSFISERQREKIYQLISYVVKKIGKINKKKNNCWPQAEFSVSHSSVGINFFRRNVVWKSLSKSFFKKSKTRFPLQVHRVKCRNLKFKSLYTFLLSITFVCKLKILARQTATDYRIELYFREWKIVRWIAAN